MDHSLSAFVAAGAAGLIAIVLAFSLIGGLMNSHRSYLQLAKWSARVACFLSGVYPLLWAHHSPYAPRVVLIVIGIWGAAIGLLWYAAGLWYRLEMDRQDSISN
jgi:hypothetical protein